MDPPTKTVYQKISQVSAFAHNHVSKKDFNWRNSAGADTGALSVRVACNRPRHWPDPPAPVTDIRRACMRMAVRNFERRGYIDQPISATLATLLFFFFNESEFFFFLCKDLWRFFFLCYFMAVWVGLVKPNSTWRPDWDVLTDATVVGGGGGSVTAKDVRRGRGMFQACKIAACQAETLAMFGWRAAFNGERQFGTLSERLTFCECFTGIQRLYTCGQTTDKWTGQLIWKENILTLITPYL